ncbi:MAG: glycosyltransferase family 2 protein [Thermoanaerobaculia bacterium]
MISLVIPVFNEEENLPVLWQRIEDAASNLWDGEEFEVVFVDDGSRDRSVEILTALAAEHSEIRIVKLSRNFGHQAALSAGLHHARGDAVVLMDADLQDPPELVAEFLCKWREGWHVAYAVRKARKEIFWKRWSYGLFYRFLRGLSSVEIPVDSGDFCLMDRRVVQVIKNEMPEQARFLRGLRAYAGFRQIGVPYDRPERAGGEAKYSFNDLVQLAISGVVGFSFVPLKIATWVGFLVAVPSFVIGILFILHRLFDFPIMGRYATETPGLATLVVGQFFLGGLTLIMLGILGEYIGRIYLEVKKRPSFIVEEIIGDDE